MKERIGYIDGLRAVAVLLVVIDHLAWHHPARPPDALAPFLAASLAGRLWHLALEGSHGVDLFFVLSGFCLSYPVLRELAASGALRFDAARFFAARVVRIVPPYYAALLIFGVPRIAQHYASAGDLAKQALFATTDTASINEAFWTLAVEFRWYLLFPLVLWLWIRSPRTFWLVMAAAIVAFDAHLVPAIDAGTLPGFMLGIVAADMQIRSHAFRKYALPACALLVPAGIAFESAFALRSGITTQATFEQTQITWQLCAFAFVVAAGYHRTIAQVLSLRGAVAIGAASYSIYLTHAPVIGGLAALAPHAAVPIFAVMAIAACIAMGFAFRRYLEAPFAQGEMRHRLVQTLAPIFVRALRLVAEPA